MIYNLIILVSLLNVMQLQYDADAVERQEGNTSATIQCQCYAPERRAAH